MLRITWQLLLSLISLLHLPEGHRSESTACDTFGNNLSCTHANYNPAWSPDGARILFDSNRDGNWQVYSIKTDGTEEQRLTRDDTFSLHSDWSPDGEWIVFQSNRDGDRELFMMKKDGSDARQLTHDDGQDDWPSWSPDGTEIAFTSDRDGDPEVFILNVESKELRQMTQKHIEESTPIWSPNGQKILFNSDGGLYVISRGGNAPSRFSVDTSLPIWKTSWSKDGMKIAMTEVNQATRNLDILVLDMADGSLRRVSPDSGVDRHPSWSPDGTKLAFTSTRDGKPDIFIYTLLDDSLDRLTQGSGPR